MSEKSSLKGTRKAKPKESSQKIQRAIAKDVHSEVTDKATDKARSTSPPLPKEVDPSPTSTLSLKAKKNKGPEMSEDASLKRPKKIPTEDHSLKGPKKIVAEERSSKGPKKIQAGDRSLKRPKKTPEQHLAEGYPSEDAQKTENKTAGSPSASTRQTKMAKHLLESSNEDISSKGLRIAENPVVGAPSKNAKKETDKDKDPSPPSSSEPAQAKPSQNSAPAEDSLEVKKH